MKECKGASIYIPEVLDDAWIDLWKRGATLRERKLPLELLHPSMRTCLKAIWKTSRTTLIRRRGQQTSTQS